MATEKPSKSKKKKKTLSKKEILHLAHLIRLELSDEDIKLMESQLGDTIDYVQNLQELETKGVKGLAHTTDKKNVTFEDGDEPDRTFSQDDATANAKNSEDGYFIVPKILENK